MGTYDKYKYKHMVYLVAASFNQCMSGDHSRDSQRLLS